MFKRMSVLVRRDGDSRAYFAEKWRAHAAFISGLPGVRGYLQNHVVEEFPGAAPLRVDGIVELRFDSPAAMAEAFKGPAAKLMAADEPGFLGHGSGYALTTDGPLRPSEGGGKLIIAVIDAAPETARGYAETLARETGTDVVLDDVAELIAKPNMAPPQPVRFFLHVFCANAEAASAAGRQALVRARDHGLAVAPFRVRTVTIV